MESPKVRFNGKMELLLPNAHQLLERPSPTENRRNPELDGFPGGVAIPDMANPAGCDACRLVAEDFQIRDLALRHGCKGGGGLRDERFDC